VGGSLFRIYISIFRLLLAAFSLWIVLPELSSPTITTLPVSPEGAAAAASHRGEAMWAARAAAVRDDLWAESAFAYANLEWADTTKVEGQTLDEARASATKAVT
jgi:hypothetical protein